jgi:hypothetical protein
MPPGTEPFRWVSRATLWRARRDTTARLFGDPSLRRRPRLLRGREAAVATPIDRTDLLAPSFAVLGDPGEGDGSQYAVVPALLGAAGDTDFAVIASDVIYPAGGVAEYPAKFFAPYRDYAAPVLAVPGNHDWYDGLDGFAWCFCGIGDGDGGRTVREREPVQPGPYWCLDTGPLRVIGIDTGILGTIDRAQGDWLRRMAAGRDVPKVLVSGAPLHVDGRVDPGPIEGGGTVLDVVHDPAHRFVAVFAGDVHNYQRYPVALPDGRVVQHVVCGGAGAYMNATHTIPRIDLPGVAEDDVRLYPLRGDSLSWFATRFDAWASARRRPMDPSLIEPDVAAALMAERLGLTPVRASARAARPTEADRAAALRVFPAGGMRGINAFADQYYDTDEPPFCKHLLRVDVAGGTMAVRCLAATGRREDELDPPVEDAFTVAL